MFESKWHACPTNTAVRNHGVRALCGHLSRRGPYRARASSSPPDEDGRSVCDACLHAIGYLSPRPPRLPRIPPAWITNNDPDQGWPTTDPDEPSGSTPAPSRPLNSRHRNTPLAA
ncbi:hypothetical protein [Actinopolyspora mzabensis]|uniref:hypothetical protein n=1 Tax=Actinopolyspora mzabensis TaxID=995066 RepID=UPI00115FB58C|nr:hypothetical protein [Actinopolyspora mzabensis]